MVLVTNFGGTANNSNAHTASPPSGVYTDSYIFPTGNLDFNGNRPVSISNVFANPNAFGASGINYRVVKGGISYGSGSTVPSSGGSCRFRIGYSGGQLGFHRDDNSGGLVIDEAGGSWAGRLTWTLHWFSVPGEVRNYSAAPTGVAGQIVVTFIAPSANGGDAIISYPIRYSKDSGPWSSWVYNVNGTQYFNGLAPGSYRFQILAANSAGNSSDVITNTVNLSGVRGKRSDGVAFIANTIGRRFDDILNPVDLTIMKRHNGSAFVDISN